MWKWSGIKQKETGTCPSNHWVFSGDIQSLVWGAIGGQSSTRSNGVWIESGTAHVRPSKLDKKGKVENKSFQQLPLPPHTSPQMSSSKSTSGAFTFGPSVAGNTAHAVYRQSSRMVTHSSTTNLAHCVRSDSPISNYQQGKTSDISKSLKQQSLMLTHLDYDQGEWYRRSLSSLHWCWEWSRHLLVQLAGG